MDNIKTQARLLAKHIKAKHGIPFSHSQALEALAAAQGEKDYNVVAAKMGEDSAAPAPAPAPALDTLSAQDLARMAREKGLTVGEAISIFSEHQSPLEKLYVKYAQDNLHRDGETEFDDGCAVSLSESGGAYVQAWCWVDGSDLPDPETVIEALTRGVDEVTATFNDEAGSWKKFDCWPQVDTNDEAITALAQDKEVAPDTVLLTLKVDDKVVVITKALADKFEWSEEDGEFVRTPEDGEPEDAVVMLSFS